MNGFSGSAGRCSNLVRSNGVGRLAIEPVPALRSLMNSLCVWNSINGIQIDQMEFSSLAQHSTCAFPSMDAECVLYAWYK